MNSRPIDNIDIQVLPPGTSYYDDAKLTIEEIGSALLENGERFDSLFHDIQTVTALFGDNCSIMPKQCREAIQSLEKAKQHTKDLHKLLDTPDHLPLIFTALRYRLIFQIHFIEEQVQQLICFIENYRAVSSGTLSSFTSWQSHQQIYRSLETLSEAVLDILQQIKFINYEAYFHQKKLAVHNMSGK